MTEPVAYMWKTERGTILGFTPNDNIHAVGQLGIPLYTAEQLHPRVKMTQAEINELKKLLSADIGTIYEVLDVINSDRGEMNEFENLYNRLFTNGVSEQVKQQNEFARLWESLPTCLADEMIEIVPVPDKKWFVRSKNTTKSKIYEWLDEYEDDLIPLYTRGRKVPKTAVKFDTKEEAELWVIPLTEAVQLPVDEK